MADRPVPLANVTTTGIVRKGKDWGDVDIVPFSLECRITKESGDAAIKHAFPVDLPANAVVDAVHIHNYSTSVIATGTGLGIGATGDPDEYIQVTHADYNEPSENATILANRVSPSTSAKTLYIHSTDNAGSGAGAGAGTIYGDWGIRVTGYIVQPLATS